MPAPGRPYESKKAYLLRLFGSEPDFTHHAVSIMGRIPADLFYFSTMADQQLVQEFVIAPLLGPAAEEPAGGGGDGDKTAVEIVRERTAAVPSTPTEELPAMVDALMEGKCLLLCDAFRPVLLLQTIAPQSRPIEEPKSEKVIRGPQEGFTENINTNMSLIRKRVKNAELHFESYTIGRQTKTTVLLAYVGGQAPAPLLEEVRSRLRCARMDAVLESANIEEWIQDKTLTPFPTLYNTERPDVVASHLLEGRVAILSEGSPMALVAPVTFFQFFVSPEDYYQRADVASLLRLLRLLSFFVSIFAPSLYIALANYHQEVLPTQLLISLSAQREGVPFPAVIEALMMLVVFELLREAGVRMPKVTGQAISIVGAVVLGQAAVEAGLVSAAMVIVVGITAITNFVTPSYSFGIAQRVLQFGFMILAACLGFFGILSGIIFIVVHLVSLSSFGTAYMSPMAPLRLKKWGDTLVRLPWSTIKRSGKG